MQEHFGFSDEQMKLLAKKNIGVKDLFQFANKFDPTGNLAPISGVTLYFYIDKKGDFMEPPNFKNKEICKQIFERLDTEDQMLVLQYANDKEEKVF